MIDKYQAIPGSMDTIDCLRKENDELKREVSALHSQIKELGEALQDLWDSPHTSLLYREESDIPEILAKYHQSISMPSTSNPKGEK
jgi:hypothetical protein